MIPVYILIRTSNRPIFFSRLMESIKAQTYQNIITIVHTDNEKDKYVYGDIIIKGKPKLNCRAPYNLYMNTLLKSIPDAPGWVYMVDDDDKLAGPDVISRFVSCAQVDYLNVARCDRGHGKIWPKYWKVQKDFQTECFLLHSKYKTLGTWWDKTGGDHHYTKQITRKLPINWIEGLVVCKAQEGKGRGLRLDAGMPRPEKVKRGKR